MTGDATGDLARLRNTLTLLQSHMATTPDDAIVGHAIDELAAELRELESSVEELSSQNDELLDIRAQLQHERRRYVDLFRHAPEPYLVTDTEGVIEQANAATCELLGAPLDGVEGRFLGVFLRPEDRPAIAHLIETLGKGATSTELLVTPTDNAPVLVSAVVVPRRSPGGRPTELRWILRDVTDARRAQDALEAAFTRTREEADELRDLDRWKNAFLAAAAHDLRAPLAVITTAVQSLLATHELGDATPLVSNIAAQANRVARLLDDLLNLDRFTRGTVAAERAPTHLPKLVEDALVLAGTDRREVQVDVPSIVVNVDRVLACQIISNLIVNAAAHTPPGTPIAVKVADRGNHVEIVVEDHGPGIPPELWEEVFRPFVTRRAHQADECGPGLGLSLVRLFAELHGGTAHMEGGPGGGARVVVRLPGRVAAQPGGSSPGLDDS